MRTLPRNPTPDQWDQIRNQIRVAIGNVLNSAPLVHRQARDMSAGFPAQSGGGGGTGSFSSPVERAAVAHAGGGSRIDPDTGQDVETRDTWQSGPDPTEEARIWWDDLDALVRRLYLLDGRLGKVLPKDYSGEQEPTCRSQHSGWEPVYASERCRWCYDFRANHGADPPAELVHAHDRGERLSVQRVRAAIASVPKPQGKKKGKNGKAA